MLLRHITNNWDRRYYPADTIDSGNSTFQQLGWSVEKYLKFFAHRNCNVGDEPVEAKTKVTVGWANAALNEMMTLTSVLEQTLNKLSDPRRPRVRPEHNFVKQACQELRDAAISHLKAISKIGKIFDEIYQRPVTPIEPRQVLEQLEAQVREEAAAAAREQGDDENDEATVMSVSSQFALFTLWTRFGMRGTRDDAGEEECLKEEEAVKVLEFEEARKGRRAGGSKGRLKQPGTLSVIRVARHSLQPQREAQSRIKSGKTTEHFVKRTVSFLADPRGITNLDLIHRALDVTTMALHAVLRRAVEMAAVARKPIAGRTEVEKQLTWLVGKVCGLRDWDIVESPTPPRNAPQLGKFFKKDNKKDGEPPNPGDRFFDKHHPRTEDVLAFLHNWPGWHDSRHMAEFFDRISRDRDAPAAADGEGVFSKASEMRRIRDRSFHGFTLLEGESISNVTLKEQVGKLRALVEQVGHVAGVELEKLDEYKALLQLQDAMHHYRRWRLSQVVIEKKLDSKVRLQKAAAAVRGLLTALEGAQGRLLEGGDASNESLEYLLRLWASLVAPPPIAGAAAAPPQVQRIRSGFKAFWADELQEGEDEDDNGDEEGETE